MSTADRTIDARVQRAYSIEGAASGIFCVFQERWVSCRMQGAMVQATGTDAATAAKLAGYKTPNVTLQYYTHSLRDRGEAVNTLDATHLET